MPGDPMRLMPDLHIVTVEKRDGLAMHLIGCAAVKLEISGGRHHVGTGLRQRLARIARFGLRQFVGIRGDRIRQPGKQTSPFRGRQFRPCTAIEGRTRRSDGGIDFALAARRKSRKNFACRRIQDRDGFGRGNPPAADETSPGNRVFCRNVHAHSTF